MSNKDEIRALHPDEERRGYDAAVAKADLVIEDGKVTKSRFESPKPGAVIPGIIAKPAPVQDESARRKRQPLARGCMRYFPDALLAVAELSLFGNDKHNPGQPLHWSKGKSNDHADCAARHLLEPFGIDTSYGPGKSVLHSVAAAWRALANAQIEIEELREQGKWPLK